MTVELLDLPVELLLQIIGELDDVFEYMRIARTCKKLQSLIKSMVLLLSDCSTKSTLFNSITDKQVQLEINNSVNQGHSLRSIFEKYQYFIFEYNATELGAILADYVCLITDLKSKTFQKIDVAYMNQNAVKLSNTVVFDPRSFIPEKLSQVSKTLFAGDSDLGLYRDELHEQGLNIEALMLMGNTHYLDNIEELPQLYIFANSRYDFKIISPTLKIVHGITNVNDKLPRLPTLFNFLQFSAIPNLQVLTGIGIESGMDLRIFERFENLNKLHLDSVFTGNVALNVTHAPRLVTLPNLQLFKISGNSISIADLSFPRLQTFDITISGSTERNFRSTIHMENIQTPNLKELYILASNVPDGPLYILKHLNINTVTTMCILSSNSSTFPKLQQLHFPNLREAKLGAYNVSSDEFTPVPFKLDAPNLKLLNVKNLQSYNQVLFGQNICYPGVKALHLHLKVLTDPQTYYFSKERFPDLEILDIGYFNKFGRLLPNNIELTLDLPGLKKLVTKEKLFAKIKSQTDLSSSGVEIELTDVHGKSIS